MRNCELMTSLFGWSLFLKVSNGILVAITALNKGVILKLETLYSW